MVVDLFRDPDSFFERKALERGLRREVLVLLLVGGIGAVGWAWLSVTFLDALAGSRDQFRLLVVGESLRVLAEPLALWLIYGTLLHIISNLLNTRSSFSRILKVTAWALLPLAIANIARSIGLYLAFSDEEIPADPEGFEAREVFNSLWELGSGDPPMLAFVVVSILVVIYVGYLLQIGLQHVRDLSPQNARRVVAVPVTLHLLLLAYTLVSYLGVL